MKMTFLEPLNDQEYSITINVSCDCSGFKFLFELKVSSEHETTCSIEMYRKHRLSSNIFHLRNLWCLKGKSDSTCLTFMSASADKQMSDIHLSVCYNSRQDSCQQEICFYIIVYLTL